MRDIKFRVWDKLSKIMRYDAEDNLFIVFPHPEDFELMQYTELRDKNGKEIFEGDIVKISELVSDKIIFIEGQFRPSKATSYEAREFMINSEIIGNVWENPELLEGER